MKVKKKILGMLLFIATISGGCIWFISDKEETIIEDDKYFRIIDAGEEKYLYTIYNADGKAVREGETKEEEILEDDKYFRIIDAGEQTYFYLIYNADGREVKNGVTYRIEPWIHYIDQGTIEIHIGVGTETFYCVYYDTINDRFSEQYESPVAAKYNKVAFLDHREGETVLIIKDMFGEGNCYHEYFLDFAEMISPVVSAEFTDEDTLLITYNSGDFYEAKTKLLYCGESEKLERIRQSSIYGSISSPTRISRFSFTERS